MTGRWERLRDSTLTTGRRAGRRVRADLSPLLQRAAAASIAWLIALWVGDHPDPFFAPIAAVVSLNASFGERGLNALRMLGGVVIGILAAELVLVVLASGPGGIALAAFLGMTVARAFGGAPVVVAQAASGAILTIAIADGEAGADRVLDALIGAGVALVFSQVLFSPEPVRLLRRAESAALTGMTEALRLTAYALAVDDRAAGDLAMDQLRRMPEQLAALRKTRLASGRVARHSPAWRSRAALVVREQENTGHLDLLGISCLMLARTSLATDRLDGRLLAEPVADAAELLAELARAPADTAVRQSVVHRVPALIRGLERAVDDARVADPYTLVAAVTALRALAVDLMVFAGVDAGAASKAAAAGAGRLEVTPRARPSRVPFVPRAARQRLRRIWPRR